MRTPRPCEACKQTSCPDPCYPLKDWEKNNRKNPCRNCLDRTPGCHGKCENYIEWKAALEESKQVARLQSKSERDLRDLDISNHIKSKMKWRK